MKRNRRHRSLAYEQLESKAAPSSILVVVSGDDATTTVAPNSIATHLSQAGCSQFETEQILRFVADNTTGGERAHRPATLPTAVQCAAADEMMQLNPAQWNSLLVLSFYDDGTQL